MTPFLDSFLPFLEVVAGKKHFRNNGPTNFTDDGRADVAISLNDIWLFYGEEKYKSHYKKGDIINDPMEQLIRRICWSEWERLFGDLPYIFGYWSVGDENELIVHLGCLVRASQTFQEIAVYNIFDLQQRSHYLLALLNLSKYLKLMVNIATTKADLDQNWKTECVHTNIRSVLSFFPLDSKPHLKKKWLFCYRYDAESFMTRVNKVYRALGNDCEYVLCCENGIKESIEQHPKRYQQVLHGYFFPYGNFSKPNTKEEAFFALKCTFLGIKHLRSSRIVHNDIRWDNIVSKLSDRTLWVLIDFDDACVLTNDDNTVPARSHLKEESHAPNISQPHGCEVDVWSYGFLFLSSPVHLDFNCEQLGKKITDNFQTITMEEIESELSKLKIL
eukprot:c7364_g1_i1.p1 GENE.c7364_g1_i1~~c7364_g1_i1.p1  ORF type:complete len:398 (-),score=122.55 c7364_g1_i1:27-1190(-)